jgi:hypothetical protein
MRGPAPEIVVLPDGGLWILLKHDKVVELSPEDADLATLRWTAVRRKKSWYAAGEVNGKRCYLHRVVGARFLDLPDGRHIDHVDVCGLSNRRTNLRAVTNQENNCNKELQINNKSGHKGVSLCRQTGRWKAQVQARGKMHWGGRHATKEDAIAAYAALAAELHGQFARII